MLGNHGFHHGPALGKVVVERGGFLESVSGTEIPLWFESEAF